MTFDRFQQARFNRKELTRWVRREDKDELMNYYTFILDALKESGDPTANQRKLNMARCAGSRTIEILRDAGVRMAYGTNFPLSMSSRISS
ncbi:hypothetical protein IB238_24130 [Rhizobium sp. ARZ01]|uniref:hypothetical protein n=1 Tax=Rhizobium sp. ARZ01 TaxID=2769313 RepID=UPI0017861898|nr:hypothetical protein [Rhizobium sp. ARZ01]MBD9375695.1 hypothetical protein [Rhizobium sp. ARZ01]